MWRCGKGRSCCRRCCFCCCYCCCCWRRLDKARGACCLDKARDVCTPSSRDLPLPEMSVPATGAEEGSHSTHTEKLSTAPLPLPLLHATTTDTSSLPVPPLSDERGGGGLLKQQLEKQQLEKKQPENQPETYLGPEMKRRTLDSTTTNTTTTQNNTAPTTAPTTATATATARIRMPALHFNPTAPLIMIPPFPGMPSFYDHNGSRGTTDGRPQQCRLFALSGRVQIRVE